MKKLNNYITEKLKINKLSRLPDNHIDDYVFVVAIGGEAFDKLCDRFGEVWIKNDLDETAGFILLYEEAEEFIDDKNYDVYKISSDYMPFKDIKDFINAFQSGDIDIQYMDLI